MQFSFEQARTLLLAAQGLHQPFTRPATKPAVLETIRRMQVLQIDTINVVARSPYLVLWSRLGDYQARWLDELLAEGALFEYWSHEASFLPIEDYPLYRQLMLGSRGAHSRSWLEANAEASNKVLEALRERGPVRSADFARTDGRVGSWWDWKPEKIALERLYTSGELMIAARHNFQRIYDLRERVLPEWDDARMPTLEAVHRELALKAVQALGITTARWVADYFRTSKPQTAALVMALAKEGALVEAKVEGWDVPAYFHPANQALADSVASGAIQPTLTTLLSPFDPIVWDRARAKALFDFSYTIECYTPAPKRQYGYFTLPILHRGRLIGRLDPKAHRKEGRFEVKALHLEPGVSVTDELISDLAGALKACAAWHKTPKVVVQSSNPPGLAALIQAALEMA